MTEPTPPGPAVEITGEPTAVYRLYDAGDRLLYVGISRSLVARWTQHEVEKDWWPQVARKTVVMYGSRREAELAEGAAIRSESPLHNKATGRRDESEPKRPARKLRAVPPKPPARSLGRYETFIPDAKFMSMMDDFARERELTRHDAMGVLLIIGLLKWYQVKNATLEDLDKDQADMLAIRDGYPPALAS